MWLGNSPDQSVIVAAVMAELRRRAKGLGMSRDRPGTATFGVDPERPNRDNFLSIKVRQNATVGTRIVGRSLGKPPRLTDRRKSKIQSPD
jgi:hypothetical protein